MTFPFPHVVVINLKRRPDRKQATLQQLQRESIQADFLEAVDGQSESVQQQHAAYLRQPLRHPEELRWQKKLLTNPAMYACMLSMQAAVGRAYARQWPSVLVMEDDVELCPQFAKRVAHFMQTTLAGRPWKVVALGASDFHYSIRRHGDGYYQACRGVYGFFCVALHQSVYQELLGLLQLGQLPPDVCLNCIYEHHREQSFVAFPNLALARLDDSDIHPYQRNRMVTREGASQETQVTQDLATFTEDYASKCGWDKALAAYF